MKQFLWIPGQGVDAAALERLRLNCRRPSQSMGEAWFMSEKRRMFDRLLGNLNDLSVFELRSPLTEIASGTAAFGPSPEWDSWYRYLLAALLPRSHEASVSYLLESLITGFIALFPNGLHKGPYKGFSDDVLKTLGQCMMDPQCWQGPNIAVGNTLHRSNNNPAGIWRWWDCSGDLAASMVFCLKYLPEPLIEEWLKSVFAITSPHWRAQVMVWMVGAVDLLNGNVKWPSQLSDNERSSITWEFSHCLRPELAEADISVAPRMALLLPEGSRLRANRLLRSHFSENLYLEWLMSISEVTYLEAELAEIPSTFESIYVRNNAK